VTPTLARPGPSSVFTYVIHVENSSLVDLQDIHVEDLLPWEDSTYQRDVVASSGQIDSDIVSIEWVGDVSALSSEQITFTVVADPDYEGVLPNTAIIKYPSPFLRDDVIVEAVAYITNDPVLQISKSASPAPVWVGEMLLYKIEVVNLGQQATNLDVWDTLPSNTEYAVGSASAGGKLVGDQIHWTLPVLPNNENQELNFQVEILGGQEVVNSDYWVTCVEEVTAFGEPVITVIRRSGSELYLPIVMR
jgi:uncharacterized repeat protein (TIGR01451 family)